MIVRILRTSLLAGLTTLMLSAGTGVASAQEGPVDHLRHRAHQIVTHTDRVVRGHRPIVVVREPRYRRQHVRARYYRVRVYDRRHHRYYYRTYRRY